MRTEPKLQSMSRILALSVLILTGCLALSGVSSAVQPVCTGDEQLISWPDTGDPLWEMCWLRPADSSGGDGSGLELREIHYRGQLVIKNAHEPILNVQYASGCGCFRDWSWEEVAFQADNVISPGYAEPTSPPLGVCETGGAGGDLGTFTGVAAEKNPTELILTTHLEAAWYRYKMSWTFQEDGTILPFFGFAAINAYCVQFTHRHNNYWRFDFDIIGAEDDTVTEINNGVSPLTIPTEDVRTWVDADTAWEVTDSQTGLGYRLRPGVDDLLLPADAFAVADAWVLAYKPGGEIEDLNVPTDGTTHSACRIRVGEFADGENVQDADLVFWYRSSAEHVGTILDPNELEECEPTGPILEPIGDWVDPDSDTVDNPADNCPFTANQPQTDGDSDDVGNLCDNCVAVANTDQADFDEDGQGDLCDDDRDGDGDLNVADNCPDVPNPNQEDLDLDMIGDACDDDRDGDGDLNDVDNCPDDPNPNQDDNDLDMLGDVCDPDDDNDGLLDTVETDTGVYVSLTDTGTDPLLADTDGDGWDDGDEVNRGDFSSDPTDPNSTPPPIPAVSGRELLILGALLLGAAALFLKRSRTAAR
jgi:hypothetical protein